MKKHLNSDARYTYGPEWCGDAKPCWIVRFCGDWVAKYNTEAGALSRAASEAAQRRGCPVVTEQTNKGA